MQWHKVTVYRGHRGAGRNESVSAYIHAEDIPRVLMRYKRMPGVKRDFGRSFPDISPISLEESKCLEERIAKEKRISLREARRTWYYPKIE